MTHLRKLRIALVFLPAVLVARAEGSLVRYDFQGHIDQATASGPGVSSQEFQGTLIYDDSIAFGSPQPTIWGYEEQTYTSGSHRADDPESDGTSLQLWIDGQAVAPESTGLTGALIPSPNPDGSISSRLIFYSHPRDETGYLRDGGAISIAFDVASSLLATGRFPDGLTAADLPQAQVSITGVMDGQFLQPDFSYSGPVDSFSITPVPEPTWAVPLLLAAAWFSRRRGAGDH